jgi:hypothetical protein
MSAIAGITGIRGTAPPGADYLRDGADEDLAVSTFDGMQALSFELNERTASLSMNQAPEAAGRPARWRQNARV